MSKADRAKLEVLETVAETLRWISKKHERDEVRREAGERLAKVTEELEELEMPV